jgi:hypothetical protein
LADQKISDLAAASALTGTELVELVQGGVNKRTTTQDIADLGAGGGGTVTSVTGTTNRITSTGGATPVIDIDPAYDAAITAEIAAAGLGTSFADFTVLTDAAPIVFNCQTFKEPKGYVETAVSRTFDLQNVRGDSVANLYSVITKLIKKTTASDIVITLDAGFTNRDIITDASVTTYTLAGLNNSYHKLTGLVFGQGSGAIIFWNHIAQNANTPLTTGSIFVGVSSIAAEKALGSEFDYSGSSLILAALGITGGKIANSTVTLAKLLGAIGSGERFLVHDNAGAVTAPYGSENATITDSTVITNLTTESGWSNDTKSVSNTLEGQVYHGTGSTGVKYFYRIKTDGTAIRTVAGEAVDITSIQLPPVTEVTGTSQQMAVNNAYIANNASRVSHILPVTASIGDIVEVTGKGAGGWRITQNSGQTIRGSSNTTTGATGYVESNAAQYSGIRLKCITANTDWVIQHNQGAITFN